jgi:hypothetical protein
VFAWRVAIQARSTDSHLSTDASLGASRRHDGTTARRKTAGLTARRHEEHKALEEHKEEHRTLFD